MHFILIITIVVGAPVGILWLCRQYHLNRGRDAMHGLPREMRDILKAPEYRRFAEYHEKRAYRIRAIVQGTGLYLLILLLGAIRHLLGKGCSDLFLFFHISLVLVPFILFFVIRDMRRAGVRTQVWCIPACMSSQKSLEKNESIVCFYDFLREEYSTEFVHMPLFGKTYAADEIFEVMAVQRGTRLKVFYILP